MKNFFVTLALIVGLAVNASALADQKFYIPKDAQGELAPSFDFFGWEKAVGALGSTSPIVLFDGPGVFKKVVVGTSAVSDLYVICVDTGVDSASGNTAASRRKMLDFSSSNFMNPTLATGFSDVQIDSGPFLLLHPPVPVSTSANVAAGVTAVPNYRSSDGTPVNVSNGLVCFSNSPIGSISGITVYGKAGRE